MEWNIFHGIIKYASVCSTHLLAIIFHLFELYLLLCTQKLARRMNVDLVDTKFYVPEAYYYELNHSEIVKFNSR